MPYHNSMCKDPICWSNQWVRNILAWAFGNFWVSLSIPWLIFFNIFADFQGTLDYARRMIYTFEPEGVDIGWLLPMDYS